MVQFEIKLICGDEEKVAVINSPFGASGEKGGIHVYIDKYFQGSMFKRQGKWVLLGPNVTLTTDDILIIGDMIEEKLNPNL